ncbi:Mitochondrial import receptor subunit TOM40 [Entamoeba marina]
MKSLLDPYAVCEPFEALQELSTSIQPECFDGVKVDITKEHTSNILTGHYITINPPNGDYQQVDKINTFLLAGKWGRLIGRIDNNYQTSLLASTQTLNGQLQGSIKCSNQKQVDAGVDIHATGFGKCFGMRWQKGGMYVINLMQKITDNITLGTEHVLVPHKQVKVSSYGVLFSLTPALITSLTYSQFNQTLLACTRYSLHNNTTFAFTAIGQRLPQYHISASVAMEKSTPDTTFRASLTTTGDFSATWEQAIRSIAGKLILSTQTNVMVGSYHYGFSLQLFR